MFCRSAQSVFAFVAGLLTITTGLGCTDPEFFIASDDPGEYYGLAASMALLQYPPPPQPPPEDVNAKTTSSDATAPSTAILIGEPNGPGAATGAGSVFLYEKSLTGWEPTDNIFAANGVNLDRFGQSLATKGPDVIVGASTASSGAGRAYVFAITNETFTQQGTLQATDAAANDNFGQAVAIDGNIALVSAPFEDQNANNAGAVYAFARTGTTWAQTQKLLLPVPDSNDSFGLALLLDGTEALISSIDDDGNPNYGGRVHCWNLASGVWTPGATLKPSDPTYAKKFGTALARQEKWLVVGAPGDGQTADRAGAVYVFERVGNAWIERQKLRANDGTSEDYFGTSVAIDGNWLVVGAKEADGKSTGSGAAYVYELDGTWTFAGKLVASQGKTGDYFGSSCAVAGNLVAIGAPKTTVDGFDFAGAGYVYTLPQAFGPQRILTEVRHFSLGRK